MRELDIERRPVAFRIQQDSLASTGFDPIGRKGRKGHVRTSSFSTALGR
jgi:hypothetical protein